MFAMNLRPSILLAAAAMLSVQAADVFPTCRFHYGTDQSFVDPTSKTSIPGLLAQVDYVTGPWTGQSSTFDLSGYYTFCKNNNKVPVNQCYAIAFAARRDQGLQDCNVSNSSNLCTGGANYIRQNQSKILGIYASYGAGVYKIMGSSPSVWLMEPDFTQYTLTSQAGGGLTNAEAGTLMKAIVSTIKAACPSAVFSMDISPWYDTTWQRKWYTALGLDQFTYINTSGGQSRGDQTDISNTETGAPTWYWVYHSLGKPVFADAGYGTGGAGTGYDARWDVLSNATARIKDGVIGIAQENPGSNWASIVSGLRPQLPAPPSCSKTGIIAASPSPEPYNGAAIVGRTLRVDGEGSFQVSLRDFQGRAVFSRTFQGPASIPLTAPEGLYAAQVVSGGHLVLSAGFASVK
jgi:hypothetical protein